VNILQIIEEIVKMSTNTKISQIAIANMAMVLVVVIMMILIIIIFFLFLSTYTKKSNLQSSLSQRVEILR
jgi:uncharacterized membrane protein